MDKMGIFNTFAESSDWIYHSPLFFLPALFAVLLTAIVLILFAISRAKKANTRDNHKNEKQFKHLEKQFLLNDEEKTIINQLVPFLKDPGKKYLLLLNQKTFYNCLNFADRKYHYDRKALFDLCRKLQFTFEDPPGIPRSSRDLLESTPVAILDSLHNVIKGEITQLSPNSFTCHILHTSTTFNMDDDVRIFVPHYSGLLEIKSRILKCNKETAEILHSDDIIRIQRRKYSRKEVNIPVHIRLEGDNSMDETSQIIDISNGGISLMNPDRRFQKDDDIIITFYKKFHPWFMVEGSVVRLTEDKKIIHLEFGHLEKETESGLKMILEET